MMGAKRARGAAVGLVRLLGGAWKVGGDRRMCRRRVDARRIC